MAKCSISISAADALTADILAGTAEHLTPEEYATFRNHQEQQAADE